ncbi:MAG: phosphonate ABC transporter, permease protein PhnE [Chloroflexi bacterium]|nr:phosphonate ABC transporter, permease protein PhnE [Chloroflexota bacterium]
MTAATMTGRPIRPSHAKRDMALLGVALVVVWAAVTVSIDPLKALELPGGIGLVFYKMFLEEGPDWSYLPKATSGMVESLQMAWIGTAIGALLSLPLGFFGAKNVSSGLASNIMRQILNAIRAFPEIILAIAIMIPLAGLGPVAGALALGLHSVGTLGKLTAEVIEGIDPGPVEAARASGARPIQIQRWGVLPQVLPEIVAFWLYRFEINIRAGAVLGVVGAGGIGFSLQQTLAFHRYPLAGTAIIVVVVATIVVDTASGWVRRRIIEGAGGRSAVESAEAMNSPLRADSAG